MIKRLVSLFVQSRVELIRVRPMSEDDLVGALMIEADHPVLQAMLELIDRSRNEARSQAKAAIKSDRETLFALGMEHGMDCLQEYLLSLRAEANRRKNAGG